jgi:hypothetical protein
VDIAALGCLVEVADDISVASIDSGARAIEYVAAAIGYVAASMDSFGRRKGYLEA